MGYETLSNTLTCEARSYKVLYIGCIAWRLTRLIRRYSRFASRLLKSIDTFLVHATSLHPCGDHLLFDSRNCLMTINAPVHKYSVPGLRLPAIRAASDDATGPSRSNDCDPGTFHGLISGSMDRRAISIRTATRRHTATTHLLCARHHHTPLFPSARLRNPQPPRDPIVVSL